MINSKKSALLLTCIVLILSGVRACSQSSFEIIVYNNYKGIEGFEDAMGAIDDFFLFPKGHDPEVHGVRYHINDSAFRITSPLTDRLTLMWGYKNRNNRKNYILYPAWWKPKDEAYHPSLLSMKARNGQPSPLLVTVQSAIGNTEDPWKITDLINTYYNLVKIFVGTDQFPTEWIPELHSLEKTAQHRGISIVRNGIEGDENEELENLKEIQGWSGWLLRAVVDDEGHNMGEHGYDRRSSKDEVLREWLLDAIKFRLYSARMNYSSWKKGFPDETIEVMCEKEDRIRSALLKYDAEFFYNHVYEEPYKGMIERAILSRPDMQTQEVCNQLLYGHNMVLSLKLNPVFLRFSMQGNPDLRITDMRLSALERAIDVLVKTRPN